MIRTTSLFSALIFLCFFWARRAHAQSEQAYDSLVKQAFKLYERKEYQASAKTFAEAFLVFEGKAFPEDRYNAACSWALAGVPDSAFSQLFNITKNGYYTNLGHISTDPDLNSLHRDKRWKKVVQQVRENKEKEEAHYDKPLVAALDSIYREDQVHRVRINEIQEKFGWESTQMDSIWKVIEKADSINLVKIKKLIDTRGWLGSDVVGRNGNSTIFLVIQHADQKTQEQYLPIMREAVAKGNALPANLALLEDRVALGQGKKQIYGSQIGMFAETGESYVLPLEDPDNVNQRRAAVGLNKLEDYVQYWGINWNAEEYKRNLPRYLEEQKKFHRD